MRKTNSFAVSNSKKQRFLRNIFLMRKTNSFAVSNSKK